MAASASSPAGAATSASPVPAHASSLHAKDSGWSGRFAEPVADFVLRYTASVSFDQRLAAADIAGSLAHAAMLHEVGVLSGQDLADIERGMAHIRGEIERGEFTWQLALEDVHLNIERRLTELVGDAGKRLHTGRSRNDQVATDVRLWLRGEIDAILALLRDVQRALVAQAAMHASTIMPGFTHLQVAQPVTFGHHLLAYVEMFERDAERLADARRRLNRLPLGAAALAGTSFPIDRAFVAQRLGFDGLCENSLDAVSDRDFAIEFCAAAALVMTHVSRLAEELVLWMSPRYGFIRLPDRFTTGSSIMPQKKNPDVPELARGKSGRVTGHLVSLLMLMKGQPLAYNKDNQEDKEPLFDTVDTLRGTLRAFAEMLPGLEVDAAAMRRAALEGFATATDLADHLVKRGLPFRDAHEAVARVVRLAAERQCDLADLPLADLQRFAPQVGPEVHALLAVEGSVAARAHVGGTAPAQVLAQVAGWRSRLAMA
ncbi:MAG: argininosuccinate lyase [Burkholderiales bacterium]|jgi:argininosuccinate lyase|nr:argininosuccinate lyase [Burkholderiales bacterium]MCA3230325.1 argininosuccinate lyase [Burkholderiales bacterium]